MRTNVELEVHQTLLKQTGSKTLALGERTLGGSIRGGKRKCKLPEACSFAKLAVLYIKSNIDKPARLSFSCSLDLLLISIKQIHI